MTLKQKISAALCCPLPQPEAAGAESVNPTAVAPGASSPMPPASSSAQKQRMRQALSRPSSAARNIAARFSNSAATTASAATAATIPAGPSALAAAAVFPIVAPGPGNSLPTRLALFGRRHDPVTGAPVALSDPWSGEASMHAWQMNHLDSFVRCADGMARRYPPYFGSGQNFSQQVQEGMIYDADKDFIVRQEAGYVFDQKTGTGAFLVNGKPRQPLPTDSGWQVFRLDDGRMLVPQPSFAACTYACEMMLLLDKGYLQVGDITKQFGDARDDNPRRITASVINSIKRRTGGLVPHQVEKNLNDPSHVREMQALLARYGPCMLGGHEHVQMLDAITLQGEEVLLTIREPFHGSAITVRRNDALFGAQYVEKLFADFGLGVAVEPETGPRKLFVDATFLPPRS